MPQAQRRIIFTAVQLLCHSDRSGAATTFGVPTVPICAGEVSSRCKTVWSLVSKVGVAEKPLTKDFASMATMVPAARAALAKIG